MLMLIMIFDRSLIHETPGQIRFGQSCPRGTLGQSSELSRRPPHFPLFLLTVVTVLPLCVFESIITAVKSED